MTNNHICKRHTAIIALVLAMLILLSACGGNGNAPTGSGSTTAPPVGANSDNSENADNNQSDNNDSSAASDRSVDFSNAPYPPMWIAVAAGKAHSAAIGSDGSLWIWGMHRYSDLPAGVSDDRLWPAKLMDGVSSVFAADNITLIILDDNTLWGWGDNLRGRIGDTAVFGNDNVGEAVLLMDDVVDAAIGTFHALAVKTDGSLWAWGRADRGQIGDGTTEPRITPVKIMDDVVSVAAAYGHSAAVKTDGSLWMWGSNNAGQLGDGTRDNSISPIKIMDDVASVAVGSGEFTLAVKTDGSLWAWGRNDFGTVGTGVGVGGFMLNPVKIMDNVSIVHALEKHAMAIQTDGSLWAWGHGGFGVLGYGGDSHQPGPIKIMDNVVAVSAGDIHTIAAKADGSLWGWGNGSMGRLGNGVDEREYFELEPIKIAN